jgi:hypothetical protein
VCYPDLLPKEDGNKHQGYRRTKLTTFGLIDDGEGWRSNNWHHEDNHMLLKTWQTGSCAAKGNQISLKFSWISNQHFLVL